MLGDDGPATPALCASCVAVMVTVAQNLLSSVAGMLENGYGVDVHDR